MAIIRTDGLDTGKAAPPPAQANNKSSILCTSAGTGSDQGREWAFFLDPRSASRLQNVSTHLV